MSANLNRYLALTSMPQLGSRVLDNEAAVLFSAHLDEVLWANAAGARLFGGTGLRTLLESPISATQPFIKQLRDAAGQIENDEPIIRGFRISRGLSMQFIQCELTPVDTEEAGRAILLVCDASQGEAVQREHDRAERAVAAMKGLAANCAILDGHGLVLAASHGFAGVSIDDEDIETWLEEMNSGGETKLFRSLGDRGDDEGACLVRLSERPERYLIVADAALTHGQGAMPAEAEPEISEPDKPDESAATTAVSGMTAGALGTAAGALADADEEDDRASESEEPESETLEPVQDEPETGDEKTSAQFGAVEVDEISPAGESEEPNSEHVEENHEASEPVDTVAETFEVSEDEAGEPAGDEPESASEDDVFAGDAREEASVDDPGESLDEADALAADDDAGKEVLETTSLDDLEETAEADFAETEKTTPTDAPGTPRDEVSGEAQAAAMSEDLGSPAQAQGKPQTVRSLLERWFMRRGDEVEQQPASKAPAKAEAGDVAEVDAEVDIAEEETRRAEPNLVSNNDDDEGNESGLTAIAATTAAVTGAAILGQGGARDEESSEASATRETEAEANDPLQEETDQEAPETEPEAARQKGEFVFAAQDDPVRFAWTIDDDQIFLTVSPELAETLGPNAADVVGRKWNDVARVFGFDTSGEIGRLLEKRDTWSGKMVLWPVQGTDLAVPVDLAALPSFGSSRSFDGFRGFGIMRTAEAVVDPNETGLALAGGMPSPEPLEPASKEFEADDFGDEDDFERAQILDDDFEAGEVGSEPVASEQDATDQDPAAERHSSTGNVVSLPGIRREQAEDERKLNSAEERAFREIGSRLGDENDNAQDTLGTDAGSPESEPGGEILDQLPWPVIVYRNGTSLYANQELLSATGYADTTEIDAAGGVEALFGGGVSEGENRAMSLRHKDGGHSQVSPVLRSVPWAGGKALLLTFRPASGAEDEVRQAIDIARVSELQHILDTATDGIIVTDRSGMIESVNGPAEALFGVDFDAASGKPLTEFFAQESHRALLDYMNELSGPGVASVMNDGREVIGKEANGGLIPLFVTLGQMGEAGKFCAVLRDITQWKKAEEELVTARRAAESASEHKSDFLTRVSHEIRTPLNSIIGFSDVMIEERFGPIGNDRYREYLRDINRSGVHILDLINDLLDISKIEAGKMELSFEAVNLNQIVSETVALLQPQANVERIIIRTSLSRSVPRVVADARTIRQIILNLVSNAIKFTPTNGQVIVSTVYDDNGEVALKVRDTGRGMNEAEIEHVLKPFTQISVAESQRVQGTGLGLPLTKALVEANRAQFDIESTPGDGTIVQVQFPTQRVLAD